jgi:hypothetical protein
MHPALSYAERIAYSSKEILHFTYTQAVKYKDSPGVYVECGVAAGAQIIAMAAGAPNKTIYAFDSFEGIPLPSNKDNQMPGIRMLSKEEQSKLPNPGEQLLESSGATSVSLEDFKNHIRSAGLKNSHFIKPIRGWFEETVQHFNRDIALLRLDGDLYNSTYVCLKYLYPKVIKGGLVIIDDWALPGCRAAVLDYFGMSVPRINLIHSGESTIAYWERKHAGRK